MAVIGGGDQWRSAVVIRWRVSLHIKLDISAKRDLASSYGSISAPTLYFRLILVELGPIQHTSLSGDCQDMSHELEGCKYPLEIRNFRRIRCSTLSML